LDDKHPESIPYSGLVATPETLDEAFDRAKSSLIQGANDKYELQNVHVSDVLIALQMIQNTLSKKYYVLPAIEQDTE
tara:strand:+ start:953 stop:1183 length:231 start_codon:yes stop_codon:yes gene_type:complete